MSTAGPRSRDARLPPGIQERRSAESDVTYRVRVRRAGKLVTGTFATPAEAIAFRAQALAAVKTGAEPPAAPTRRVVLPPQTGEAVSPSVALAADALVGAILAGTVRNKRGASFKPSVARKYESVLRVHVVPRIGALPVAALSRREVQRFVDELAAERGAETARKALTALRVALRLPERDGVIEANPCTGVTVPADEEGEAPARILTPEEAAAIVQAADAMDARLKRSLGGPLFALAFGSGLRSGELLALVWGQDGLDLEDGVVRVRRSLDRDRGEDAQFPLVGTKTKAARNRARALAGVPLDPADVARLRRHRLATGRPKDGALVFATAEGKPLDAKGIVRYAWEKAVAGATIAEPLPRLHDSRHAWATAMLAAGLGCHAVAELGGWRDAALVWRRYGHALPDELAGAGQALARFRASRTGG